MTQDRFTFFQAIVYLSVLVFLFLPSPTMSEDRFAILARENPTGDWDGMRSTIWECTVPDGDGDPTFSRKLDFGTSHWAPTPFFFGRDHAPEVDRWIRIQRNVGDSFDVALYDVDFARWTKKPHLRAPQISEIGVTREHGFFIVQDQGMFRLRFEDGKIEKQKRAFRIIHALPDAWLVSYEDDPEEQLSLIAKTGEKILQTVIVKSWKEKRQRAIIKHSPDGRWIAFFFYDEIKGVPYSLSAPPFSFIGTVACELLLIDLEKGSEFRNTFSIVARPGSGVGTIPVLGGRFSEDSNTLEFFTAKEKVEESWETSVDAATLNLEFKTLTKAPYRAKDLKETKSGLTVPPYLKAAFEDLDANPWPEQRLALALIRQLGKVEFLTPTGWGSTRVGYSKDGKRFLLNGSEGNLAGFFYYGDIENAILKQVKSLEELHLMPLTIYPIP